MDQLDNQHWDEYFSYLFFLQKLVNDFAQRLKVKKNVCVEMPFEKAHLPGGVENYDEMISKHLN